MKFYIASSSKFIDDVKWIAKKLEKAGHTCTREWWKTYVKDKKEFESCTDIEFYQNPLIKLIEKLDFQAIDNADIVIIFNQNAKPLTGALIELGYAVAKKKIVITMGEMKRSAMIASCIHVHNSEQLLSIFETAHINLGGN